MGAPSIPINRLTNSLGLSIRTVKVTQVDPDQGIALAVDEMNVQVTLPLFVTRAAARPAQPGEVWLIDQSLGFWSFAALVSSTAVTASTTTLEDLADVADATPSNGQILRYNATTAQWEAATTPGPNPWVWTVTDGLNDGFTIIGTTGSLKQLITIKDHANAPIFSVGSAGGAAVFGDHIKVFPGGDIINPNFDVDPNGQVTIKGFGRIQLGSTLLTETDVQNLHSHVGANTWLYVMTNPAVDGMTVRGIGGSLNTIFGVQDGGSNQMFGISPLGGTAVYGSQFRVFTGVFGSASVTLDPSGTITVAGTATLTLGAQTLSAADITALHGVSSTYVPNTAKGAASGVATLDSSSHLVQLPALPTLSVYRSAAFSLTGTSLTAVPWDVDEFQDNVTAGAMHSTSTNTTRLIAPVTGKYSLAAILQVASNASAPYLTIQIKLNGTTVLRTRSDTGAVSQANSVGITTTLKLNASDYVEVLVSSTVSAQALVPGSSTCFASLALVSA